jgi:hypothetical protein
MLAALENGKRKRTKSHWRKVTPNKPDTKKTRDNGWALPVCYRVSYLLFFFDFLDFAVNSPCPKITQITKSVISAVIWRNLCN